MGDIRNGPGAFVPDGRVADGRWRDAFRRRGGAFAPDFVRSEGNGRFSGRMALGGVYSRGLGDGALPDLLFQLPAIDRGCDRNDGRRWKRAHCGRRGESEQQVFQEPSPTAKGFPPCAFRCRWPLKIL